MKILFYFPNENHVRTKRLSYTNLMEGGFSGTETALLEMSNYLVIQGHEVQIYGGADTYTDSNIKFISEQELHAVDLEVDWYSPLFWAFSHQQKCLLKKLDPHRTKIFMWFQCFVDDHLIREIKQHYQVYAQCVSKYVAKEYTHLFDPSHSWVVYNGIHDLFTTEIPDRTAKRGNWTFHAVYERGGSVAKNIFLKMNDPVIARKLQLISYYTPDHNQNSSTTIVHGGSKSKLEVRNMLLESDYFVYPLVLEDGRVHHDTFGTVMLEALACGTIVVVWDVACVSSVYEDYVVKIPVPDKVKEHYNPSARFAQCNWMLTDEAQQLFIDKIKELESNQDHKESIRTRGMEWARKITWKTLGAEMEKQLMLH